MAKVFIALCKALGIWQDSGKFQIDISALCNEFNAKKIDFKLIVSIHPAHFLTMSNPHGEEKRDSEGNVIKNAAGRPIMFLTNGKKATVFSCHSFDNGYECTYRNGAIGYARDAVTMIAFTVKDFNDKAAFNWRKTSRQLFMYEVGNGVLLQSRLYDSEISGEGYGGVEGVADDIPKYKIYRELIEREIAECENIPNFWGKADYYNHGENCYKIYISEHNNFGGYADWIHFPRLTKITVLKALKDTAKAFTVGESGLCIECGNETSADSDLLCDDCAVRCRHCNRHCDEVELNEVYNSDGERILVCDDCLQEHYHYCEQCGTYHHESRGQWIRDWRGNYVEWVLLRRRRLCRM